MVRSVRSALVVLVAVAIVATVRAQMPQVVDLKNPGFEEGLDGWSSWYARQPVTVTAVDGPNGKCLRALGEEGSRVVVSQAFDAAPQQWYTVRYRYYAGPNGASGGCMGYCRITFRDQNGTFLDYPSTHALLDTFDEWVDGTQTFKTPLSIGTIDVGFNQTGASDLRIDDVVVELVPAPTPRPNTWDQLARRRSEPIVFSSWQYTNSAKQFRDMGLKYGWRYRLEEQYEELKSSRTVSFWRGEDVYARYAAHGIKAAPYIYFGALDYRNTHYNGEPPEDIPQMVDPVWHDGYVHACREVCEHYGQTPGIEYVFVQDESYGRFKSGPIAAEKRTSELWATLDDTVREKYGRGLYGLPTGPDDKNPYRWIAYYSWAADTWAQTFRRLREVIDESGCGAKLLGPDEVGMLMPLPWAELAQSVDVFTGQCLYSRGSAQMHVAGFTTKYSHDLTGKPVHNATQIVKYSGSPSPEEVQRQYSEVLQNGGEGQMLIAVEWFDRELNHHQFSAPERWATIKNLLRLMSEYEVQTPAEGNVALLYSSISGMAQGTALSSNEMLSAYAICGPKLHGWPIIVDSRALHNGTSTLDDYDVIVMPHAPYETPEVFAQLESFVARGGLLVCADPGALQTDQFGDRLGAARLLGARPEACERQRDLTVTWPGEAAASRLRVYAAECYTLRPTSRETQIVGTYPDGTAAATLRPLGSGYVLMFGANPFGSTYVSEDEQWQDWWRQLLGRYGTEMNLPIWDLRLPDEALVQAEKPTGVCLTGNSFVRCQNGVYLGANRPVEGYYTMSVAPDVSAESAGDGRIAFADGDLTDRVQATKGPFDSSGVAKEPYREADWANRWSAGALTGGLDIDFVFAEPQQLSRVAIWYSGAVDGLTASGSEGNGWRELATVRGENVGPDVVELVVPVAGSYSHLRLHFADPGGELAIGDIEVWGE